MAEGDFQVVFRGELTGDLSEEEVRQKLAALFKMPEAKVAGLFTGKPIVVKRHLDEATARKFEAAFRKAGAECEIRSASESASPTEPESAPAREVPSAERHGSPSDDPASTGTGGGDPGGRESIAAAGDPNRTMLELEVPADLSGLDVDTSDAPLSPGEQIPDPDIDIGDLSVVENDTGNLSEHEPPTPPDIDTGDLSLEDPEP
ncbi:MAG: hypothetical protein U5K33_05925 [Halofilum sp. (in: g-proteobacteria)]|nr:hypothetical protein [Halofilum sp. (in: g-proteobacteria)]